MKANTCVNTWIKESECTMGYYLIEYVNHLWFTESNTFLMTISVFDLVKT